MASFTGRRPGRRKSSRAVASSTNFRWARRLAVDFVIEDLSKQLKKPIADLRIALLWENRAFGKSVGDGIRAYTESKKLKLAYDEGYDQFSQSSAMRRS